MSGDGSRLHYYSRVCTAILPHLRGRPARLTPETSRLAQAHPLQQVQFAGRSFHFIPDTESLLWAVHSGAHEFRIIPSRAPALRLPSTLLLLISRGKAQQSTLPDLIRVAFRVRHALERLELRAFARTGPEESLIIEVPLNPGPRGGAGFREASDFARALVENIKTQRTSRAESGAVLCWRLNEMEATSLCPYSLEQGDAPGVSTPLTWEELACVPFARGTLRFSPSETMRALEKRGDPFQEALTLTQYLPVTVRRWLGWPQAA